MVASNAKEGKLRMYTILIACFSINDTGDIISAIHHNALPLAPTAAATGEEALARILDSTAAAPFDILLVNIAASVRNGFALSRQARLLSPCTRIILCGAPYNPECMQEAICIGIQDYLPDSATHREIAASLRQTLSSIADAQTQQQNRSLQTHIVKSHLLWLALHDENFHADNSSFLGRYYHMLMLDNKNEYFNGQAAPFWQSLEELPLPDLIAFSTRLEEIFDLKKNEKANSLIYTKYCFLELVKIMLKTGCISADPEALSDQICRSGSISELLQTIRRLADSSADSPRETSADSLKVGKVKQFICQHYEEPLSLNDIAAHFYITPNYLCAIFKRETGGNVMRFLNDYRLKRACELLLATQMKVHQIAEAVGFRNTSYFCQKFRDAYGETPESFRQRTAAVPVTMHFPG